MEKLRRSFSDTRELLDQTRKKLLDGQLLTDQDCLDIISKINELSQEQRRLKQELGEAQAGASDCTSLDQLESALAERRRREEEKQLLMRCRETVAQFLSIYTESEKYTEALERFQAELAACNDDDLLCMERDGKLEEYRSFIRFVQKDQASFGDAEALTDAFGYQLPFALLGRELKMAEAPQSVQEPEASPDIPGETGEASSPEEGVREAETEPPQRAAEEMAERLEETPPAPPAADVSGKAAEQDGGNSKLKAVNPVKQRKASVEGFRNAMKRLPLEANILLPALSQLGVLNVEQAVKFSSVVGWDVVNPDIENYTAQIVSTFHVLAEKGFAAGYETGEHGVVYCLTEYGYDCLHKPTIMKEAKKVFNVPVNRRESFYISVGGNKFLGEEQVDEAALLAAFSRNEDVLRYLSCMKERQEAFGLSEDELKALLRSLLWRDDCYTVKVPAGGKLVTCRVCHSQKDCSEGAALFLTSEWPEHPWADGPVVFLHGKELMCWEGEWTPLAGVSEPETPAEEAAETEARPAEEVETEARPAEEAAETEVRPAEKQKQAAPAAGKKGIPAVAAPQSREEEADQYSDESSAQDIAKRLLGQSTPVRTEQLLHLTVKLIAEVRIAEALTLVEALEKAPAAPVQIRSFCRAFRQSVQTPGTVYPYSSDEINQQQGALPEDDPDLRSLQQGMILSTLLWAMVFPSNAYDHGLYNNVRMIVGTNEDQTIQNLIALLSEDLKNISFQNDGLGFSPAVISSLVNNGERERQIRALREQASVLKRTPTSTINITGLETCLKHMVGPTSKIGFALAQIEVGAADNAAAVCGPLKEEIGEDFLTSDSVLEDYIDQCWNHMRRSDSQIKVRKLEKDTPARRVCKKALTDRIAVIKSWMDIIQAEHGADLQQSRDKFARILNQLKALLEQLRDAEAGTRPCEAARQTILRRTAERMLSVLSGGGPADEKRFFEPLWLTPELMLDENGELQIISELYRVPGLEPWRSVLRAIAAGPEDPEAILEQIDDYRSERWYRNYGTEALLRDGAVTDRTQGIQNARRDAEHSVQAFKSDARLKRAYGKIQEHEMETAFSALELARKVYFQNNNYASFKGFLLQLDEVLDREIEARAVRYGKQLQELEAAFAGTEMLETVRRAWENRNFVSMDSYINLLQSGEKELPESDRMEQRVDFLAQFQDCEEGYYAVCQDQRRRMNNPAHWGERALDEMEPKYRHWTSPNEKKKGCGWLNSWILGKSSNTSAKVQGLLTGLGFHVKRNPVLEKTASTYEVFRVSVEKTSPNLKDYIHPIYKFGTDLSDPMNVVCLYGCKGASTLINVMTSQLQLNGSTIVLMDGSLTVADRHSVSAQFKADTSGQSPFLLIDRVLLLYLASLDDGDRLKAMLHCTLPYTFEVLYGNGSGAVPEEMFIGRVSEMNDLRNMQGPCLVYGGRQLGKTALLNRASKTIHNPGSLEYSFCVDIKDEGSRALLEKVNRHLAKLELVKTPCTTLESLCETLQSLYEGGKINRLQVFVDEVDELFREFNRNDFKALRPFIVLRDNTRHHVKFVFAGTHNVAATDKADTENSNLVHMGRPLCIEPLSAGDAIKLIRIPMSYLGFEIGDSQIELILSNTNSYPGLIHMFCNALIQSVCRDYALYYSGGQGKENPPYHISDEQMRAVFKEKDIRKEIGTRVMATIKLNQKYRVLSSLLAHMIYEDRENEHERLYGHSARELLDYNKNELQIALIEEMPEKDLEALLDEMVRMGILWKNDQTREFRFRQQDFLYYIGSNEQVIELLLSEGVEGGVWF